MPPAGPRRRRCCQPTRGVVALWPPARVLLRIGGAVAWKPWHPRGGFERSLVAVSGCGRERGVSTELSAGLIVVPGGTISSMRSSTSSDSTASAAASCVSSCSMVRGPVSREVMAGRGADVADLALVDEDAERRQRLFGLWNFAASTTSSRRPPASAWPTISSDSPAPSTSAVPMKLMPPSSAPWMISIDSSWSVLPDAPNIIAPRQKLLTSRASTRCAASTSASAHAAAPRSRSAPSCASLQPPGLAPAGQPRRSRGNARSHRPMRQAPRTPRFAEAAGIRAAPPYATDCTRRGRSARSRPRRATGRQP